jgi:hypothetical protein
MQNILQLTLHFIYCRQDGTQIKFLFENTLHMTDRVMWMLPFVTRSDLEAAAQQADVSMETRNRFLNKLLHEHGQPGIRKQLQSLWTEWVEKTYGNQQQAPAVAASLEMEAATPPDDDDVAPTAAAGGGGSGGGGLSFGGYCISCWTMRGYILVEPLMMQRCFNEIPLPKLRWITNALQLHYYRIITTF